MEENKMEKTHVGTTESGFAFEIEHARVDSFELLDELVALRSDKTRIVTIARMLLGEEQLDRLKEHLRGENGIVPLTAFERELAEIFAQIGQAKN